MSDTQAGNFTTRILSQDEVFTRVWNYLEAVIGIEIGQDFDVNKL